MNSKKIIIIFAGVLAVAAAFHFSSIKEKESNDFISSDSENNKASSTLAVVGEQEEGTYRGDGYTLEVIKDKPVDVPRYLLNKKRAINFSPDFSPEAQKIILEKISIVIDNIAKEKKSHNDWIALGLNLKIAGDVEGARRAWEYVKVLYPTDYVAPNNLGDLYHYYLKNYSEAEKNMLKAVENNSAFIEGYKNLYDLYVLSYVEKKNLALSVLERGLKANPDNTDLKNWISLHK